MSPPPDRPYHHGNLRQALVDAALAIAREQGLEQVTVREAGKRAGVSSGAPFRHFPTKAALMTAVAEEAMQRFREDIRKELTGLESLNALERFRALGTAYLGWVVRNPTHFEVISMRRLIDFEGSETLVRLNEEVRVIMVDLLQEAHREGLLRPSSIEGIPLQARAFVYGLARMWVDGQFTQWGGMENAEKLMRKSLDDYVALLARPG